jgi:hypothetical protein
MSDGTALMATLVPSAHLLHWYFLPLYAAPIVFILYVAIRDTLRHRRGDRDLGGDGDSGRRSQR